MSSQIVKVINLSNRLEINKIKKTRRSVSREQNKIYRINNPNFLSKERSCIKCGDSKKLSEFPINNSGKFLPKCLICLREYNKEKAKKYRDKNKDNPQYLEMRRKQQKDFVRKKGKDYRRAMHRKSNYGLTNDSFLKIINEQYGSCAICKNIFDDHGKKMHIDHDHKSGMVRGILCYNCNTGIGLLKENPDYIKSALSYLEKHRNH